MLKKIFEKIFGKRNSIQRKVITTSIIYILIVIAVTILLFYLFVHKSIKMELVEISIKQKSEVKELLGMSGKSIRLVITSIIITTIGLIAYVTRKTLNPVAKITEATKRVAAGDFTVQLQTDRNDELGELTHNFNKMVRELNSIECLQKDFINNVSHEIKTPISSIQGFAKLLEEDDLSKEERKEYSAIIKEEADRLLYLSTNMLKLAKLENQERLENTEEICVAEQIRRTISVLEPKWKEKNIKFNVSLKEDKIFGERDLLFQVWMNIIENSIKYSKQNGQIDIKMKTEENKIITEIKDNGQGISKEECEKIFDRFYQIDKTHSGKGAGLGLAIVKRIIELSNGSINVKSELNKGTIFTITLPIKM